MQVILLQRIEKLGQMGQVVEVKAGYARNYLLAKKMALRATKQNLGVFDNRRVELEAHNLKLKTEAHAVAEKMEGIIVSLIRQASEMGHLYGSVRPSDIVQQVSQAGFTISRSQVQIDAPIKNLGMHPIRILLHPEVAIEIKINVAQSEEEAMVQATAHLKEGSPAETLPEQALNPSGAPEPRRKEKGKSQAGKEVAESEPGA